MKIKVCRVCGRDLREVETKPSRIAKRKYCSWGCRTEGIKGEGNPNYDNRWTDKQKEHLSEVRKGNPRYSGENHPLYGKQHSVEMRKKISKGQIENHFGREWQEGNEKFHLKILKNILVVMRGNRCQRCGVFRWELARDLSIHHKNGDTSSNVPENIIVLCMPCHMVLHHRMWRIDGNHYTYLTGQSRKSYQRRKYKSAKFG